MNLATLLGALKSKTIWLSLATMILSHVDTVTTFVTSHVSPSWAVTILGAGFAFLRYLTGTSLAAKGATPNA